MKDTKETVLFFAKQPNFNGVLIASEIMKRFPSIGNPIMVPKEKQTLIAFQQNEHLKLQINNETVILTTNYDEPKLASYLFDLVDIFNDALINFKRIGMVTNLFLSPSDLILFKNKYLIDTRLKDVSDFNLSFYRELQNNLGSFNCWERFITDQHQFADLLLQVDVNSVVNTNIDLSMKYLKAFIKMVDETVSEMTL